MQCRELPLSSWRGKLPLDEDAEGRRVRVRGRQGLAPGCPNDTPTSAVTLWEPCPRLAPPHLLPLVIFFKGEVSAGQREQMAALQASCSVNDLGESRFSCAEDLRVPARTAISQAVEVCSPESHLGDWKLLSLPLSLSQTRKLEQSSKKAFSCTLGKNEQWKKEIESFGEFTAAQHWSLK